MTLLTIPETVERYTINGKPRFSRWFLYTNTKKGTIPSIRISGKIFIEIDTFEKYLNSLQYRITENSNVKSL